MSEISAPDMIEANISADAAPAASPMRTIAIISCPAPFERLEVHFRTPTIGNRNDPEPYEGCGRQPHAAGRRRLANDVGKQAEETRALDGAGELTLLLGGHRRDAAPHDLCALRDVTHSEVGNL